MKQNAPRWMQSAVKDIRKTYGFLFERGYDAFSVDVIDMGRQVTLRKQDVLIRIGESRGEEAISFRKDTPLPDEFTDIGSVIYAATGDKIPPWESSSPKVLAQYLDRIEAYFGGEYVNNKDGLRTAQEEYYAGFSQGGVVVPPEPEIIPSPPSPKIIPILHYPLMAIVLLLLFGALLTLYMVLLDRLLAAFSLEADSFGLFMGVIPLLLAIGTMLLFRRRRKKG
ncbi:MAG TPA: LPXTG cell wall anchor domain-containing protein [Anaerolineales bacterium]|nr:LPXTG cell wall anchor domain-containing protein [Anaerolineales bacterium]